MAQWSEAASFRWRKLGCNCIHTSAWLLLFFFFNGFLLFGFVLFPLRGYFFFFPFIVFLPFGFVLFILTADLVSFARFLRKRISSFRGKQGALLEAIRENNEPRGRQGDFLRERA